jgi:hypothetical protein
MFAWLLPRIMPLPVEKEMTCWTQALSIVLRIQIQVDSKENTVLLTKMMNAGLERPCCEDTFCYAGTKYG